MIKTLRVADAPDAPNPHGVSVRKLYDTEHAQLMHITLQPGEALKRHITPVDVFFYAVEGRGVVEIGDERVVVEADTIVESPARIPHRLVNESDAVFRVLVAKVPRPTEATRLL